MLFLTWHGYTAPTKESVCDFVTPRSLPQHDLSTPCKNSICEFVTPRVDTQDHVVPTIQSHFSNINLSFNSQRATASQVIEDVMRQLSFEKTKLDGKVGFGEVASSGIDSSRLSHDESFGVDDLDLNVSQIKTQAELPVFEVPMSEEADVGISEVLVFEEADIGRTQEHIVE
nr:hypothetical protein [Tanacetum cinerariifolium]